MSYRKLLLKLLPKPLFILGFNTRCLLRYIRIVNRIESRPVSVKSALIVAPHPDDETFGCGGLIALKLASGASIRVVLLTDGEAVQNECDETRANIINSRRQEFINACEELGLDASVSLKWLHLPDSHLPHPGQPGFYEATKALGAEIEIFAPDEIYCPHLQDVLSDHVASTRLTIAARRLANQNSAIFYYPVWIWYLSSLGLSRRLDLRNAWRLDISRAVSAKHRALAAYLDAPVSANGAPYCGSLPWALLWSVHRPTELFFRATEIDLNFDESQLN